jgi:hypothetical protein
MLTSLPIMYFDFQGAYLTLNSARSALDYMSHQLGHRVSQRNNHRWISRV